MFNFQCNLTNFADQFEIGVSLHACGTATDLMLAQCYTAGASYVVCPCCYGAIRPTGAITYPRSRRYGQLLLYKVS